MIIPTSAGALVVSQPSPERVEELRHALPMGDVRTYSQDGTPLLGIVMQRGEHEVWALKQQTIDLPLESATDEYCRATILVAAAVGDFLRHGFSGVLLPLVYSKSKGNLHEVGIAYFATPSPAGREAQDNSGEEPWDSSFGVGFTRMVRAFMEAVSAAQAKTGLRLHPTIGYDRRPRLAIGTLYFGLALHRGDVFALNKQIVVGDDNPKWSCLRLSGIENIYHVPSVPTALPDGSPPGMQISP